MKHRLLFSCLLSFSLVLQGQVTDGLVGAFNFTKGSFSDATGRHDCQFSSAGDNKYALAPDRFGNDSCAIDFQGLILSAGGNARDITTEVSVSLWIKTTDTPGGHRYILTKYGYNQTDVPIAGYSMIFNDSVRFDSRDEYYLHNDYLVSNYSEKSVNDGEWHHLAGITRNLADTEETVLEIWIDGTMARSSNYQGLTNKLNNPVRNLCIGGSDFYPATPAFRGLIDDIRIFNRALDSVETVQIMNEQNPFLAPEIEISAAKLTTCAGSPIQFEAVTTDTDSIEWYFGDGSVSKETAPLHTYSEAGSYTVTAVATNGDNGIRSSDTIQGGINVSPVYFDTVTVEIEDTELPYAFGTQSLTEGGIYTETFQSVGSCDSTVTLTLNVIATGLRDAPQTRNDISVWPSPSNGIVFVRVDYHRATLANVAVVNMMGQEVYKKTVPSGSPERMDLSLLRKGLYLVKVKCQDKYSVHKILIE